MNPYIRSFTSVQLRIDSTMLNGGFRIFGIQRVASRKFRKQGMHRTPKQPEVAEIPR